MGGGAVRVNISAAGQPKGEVALSYAVCDVGLSKTRWGGGR